MSRVEKQLAAWVEKCVANGQGQLTLLTGAGVSTYSGIPDYRGEQLSPSKQAKHARILSPVLPPKGPAGVYTRNPEFKPITFQQFTGDAVYRRRYWARSYVGWPRIQAAPQSQIHKAVAEMDSKGWLAGIITQNVDGLHVNTSHTSTPIVEMHGSLHRVECLSCAHEMPRSDWQDLLAALNPEFTRDNATMTTSSISSISNSNSINNGKPPRLDVASSNPDGDVDLESSMYSSFLYPPCPKCGTGMMKPQVVFFGESLKPLVKEAAFNLVSNHHHHQRNSSSPSSSPCAGSSSKGLLVLGSSLTVYSAFRLVKMAAAQLDQGVLILNLGETRADRDILSKMPGQQGWTSTVEEMKRKIIKVDAEVTLIQELISSC